MQDSRRTGAPPGAPADARTDALELWAGIECTVNRVHDRFFDQIERSGHAERLDDLDRVHSLGVRVLRYPVLWERVAPRGLARANWSWADERLGRLRELGIEPIVGLVHHGSGPRSTDLLDPDWPLRLAEYAHAVAERYPWVRRFTPVNEPLTTARFSALYGAWYPHASDDRSFASALLHQLQGVRLAMRAIRSVSPEAELVQTEDMGKVYSTRTLAYQAAFENARRWLTFDLLCGRLEPRDLLWRFLVRRGEVPASALESFRDDPCPPALIGINHYLTSERYLDTRLHRYPESTHGGNPYRRYADVEAVRVWRAGTAGPETMLMEAWERYRRPVAITEAHLGCTREQQMRWLVEVWDAAQRARRRGADVRAVTAWSLFGAFDWNSLLTRDAGSYEPGVFDVRGGAPRETALAKVVRDLASAGRFDHPAAREPGWWRTNERFLYPPSGPRSRVTAHSAKASAAAAAPAHATANVPPLLIVGATGTLGSAIARLCMERGLRYIATNRAELDVTSERSVAEAISRVQPWAVINASGHVRVDDAEREHEACFAVNAHGARLLAECCAQRELPFVTFSTDLVFDGEKGGAYVESDAARPLSVYGASKLEAEQRALQLNERSLVVRTSAFFGPWDHHNFLHRALGRLEAREACEAASDAIISPTYVPDLVHAMLDLLLDGERGIWHLANDGAVSWAEFARRAARVAALDEALVLERPMSALPLPAARPRMSALGSERAGLLPPLDTAIERFIVERSRADGAAPESHRRVTMRRIVRERRARRAGPPQQIAGAR